MGATCTLCDHDMALAFTCDPARRPGVSPYGQDMPAVFYEGVEPPRRCRDCGVALGGAHHLWCCVAGCITHLYDQRLCCGCDDEHEQDDDDA